ncbi:MAG: hypothetical protein OXC31_29420 [Spirochaetaceae bacterium]|nr:hypothetical protein [Spirochaetaceae bacterium]
MSEEPATYDAGGRIDAPLPPADPDQYGDRSYSGGHARLGQTR